MGVSRPALRRPRVHTMVLFSHSRRREPAHAAATHKKRAEEEAWPPPPPPGVITRFIYS